MDNESQRETLDKAFKHKISLIWGPTATEKSEVLVNIILQRLFRNRSERILNVLITFTRLTARTSSMLRFLSFVCIPRHRLVHKTSSKSSCKIATLSLTKTFIFPSSHCDWLLASIHHPFPSSFTNIFTATFEMTSHWSQINWKTRAISNLTVSSY